MKIVHISDVHIKNFKFHKQYSEIFEALYEKIKEVKPDIILNTGDTAHTKLDLSPAYFEMTAKFFEKLAEIAPLHVILGNHDLNLSNKDRQDAVTPIVEALKNPNIHLHKYTTKFTLFDNFDFHVLSIVDEDNWNFSIDENKTNIAIFHGSVAGSQTDTGFAMTHGDIEYSTLEKYDFALLGDIHKTNQALDYDGRCRYPGSLIQQNHGETNDKGFLLWDIRGKDDFNVEHIQIPNPYPFFTIELTEEGKLPEGITVSSNARLRLLSKHNLSAELMKKASDVAKDKFKPESISFLTREVGNNNNSLNNKILAKEDLRNKKVQEKLITEYLADYKVPNEIMQEVFSINSRYNSEIEATEEVCRNINWKLKSIQWDNLFNYGEDNSIDFDKLSGIVGIFGKNYSGKSSIIDSILYSIFNTTSKNERKTTNVINQTRSYGSGKAVIEVDGFEYYINRKAEKYTKKLKGETSEEAKTELSLRCFDPVSSQWDQMNELSRTDTDKRIRKMFGTVDDFMLTSFSSQLDSMSFIREGSTRRKEILARFLDLEIFESKFKMAKEESANLKGLLKKLEGKDYDTDIITNIQLLDGYTESLNKANSELEQLQVKISDTKAEIASLQSQISECGVESLNINYLLEKRDFLASKLSQFCEDKEEKEKLIVEEQALFNKIEQFISTFDLQDLKDKKDFITDKQKILNKLHEEIVLTQKEMQRFKDKLKLLTDIPCGTQFPTCKFIKDAYDAKMQIPLYEDCIDNDKQEHDKVAKDIEGYDLSKINSQLSKYEQILQKKSDTEKKILKLQFEVEKLSNDIAKTNGDISSIEIQIEQYKKNNELFAKIDELKTKMSNAQGELNSLNIGFVKLDKQIKDIYICIGSTKNKIETLENEKKELEDYRNQFAAYDYFMRCMHSNGISYEIIKKKLPFINAEITKVLSNIVEFEVYFEDDGARLNVFIKHPKYEPRPIEMGSGAEKTIAAMAIRLSLLQVSNLPKCNFMVMDEPGTALDSENMDGFVRILEMAKSYYDVVLLISHMDALKDIVDTVITIDKKDGYAYVRV
jgi:DNA repair exonuclease SbcCD ATPase subunit/predicted phosphodiesterase